MNTSRVQVAAATAPVIAAMDRQIEAGAQQYIDHIHQLGADTTERVQAGETANAQNVQGFCNYLLDRSVVQNNKTGAQATLWNNAANALVQANPNKYSYVPASKINLGSQY